MMITPGDTVEPNVTDLLETESFLPAKSLQQRRVPFCPSSSHSHSRFVLLFCLAVANILLEGAYLSVCFDHLVPVGNRQNVAQGQTETSGSHPRSKYSRSSGV